MKKTLLIGASTNPDRSSYEALVQLKEEGHEVVAIGARAGEVEGVSIVASRDEADATNIHSVGLYINEGLQAQYYDFIIGLKPKRIFFNPGTENPAFFALATSAGIECINRCMIITMNEGKY